MKYGICSWVVPKKQEELFSYVKKLGLDGITLELTYNADGAFSISKDDIQLFKDLSKKYSIEIPTLALNGLCIKGMTKSKNREDVSLLFDKALEICKLLNIKMLQVPSFLDSYIYNSNELNESIFNLKLLCEKTIMYNIKVGTENGLNIEQNRYLLSQINMDNLFIFFDTQNTARCTNISSTTFFEELQDDILQIHLKDSHDDINTPLQLGEGNTHFIESCKSIKESKYNDWLILESEYKVFDNFDSILKNDIETVKSIFGKD